MLQKVSVSGLPSTFEDEWIYIQQGGIDQDFAWDGSGHTTEHQALHMLQDDPHILRELYSSARRKLAQDHEKSKQSLQLLATAILQKTRELSLDCSEIEALARQVEAEHLELDDNLDNIKELELLLPSPRQERAAARLDLTDTRCNCSLPLSRRRQDDDTSSNHSGSPVTVPMLVEEFFRLARLEFVARERLDEFDLQQEAAFTDELEAAGSQKERADVSEKNEKRQALLDAYSVARHQMESQREACMAAAIDPEDYRFRGLSEA
ncbi:hypothetical protein LTR09_012930 [Extremus antarcticus]|uniref:Uncharacterized protein n=1 Tax=Extremus antarcticus TaxID=702011 RepID=A0AAJ0G3J3_9PEZI|nr:hypothetical protein LTR09_012930 [Extremus antarcticus]